MLIIVTYFENKFRVTAAKGLAMTDDWLLAFDSTQQALRAEMLLEYADIDIDLCPTPKEITAGCALSIGFPEQSLEIVKQIVSSERVELRGIFVRKDGKYELYEE